MPKVLKNKNTTGLQTIVDTLVWQGQVYSLVYKNSDFFDNLPIEKCRQVYSVCFYQNKMVIVKNKDHWSLPGGTVEKGENLAEALKREIREETNMKVLKYLPIGYQEVTGKNSETIYQLRYCCLVKPLGKFEKDPAGSVVEIKMINPRNYNNYFDWGQIGEQIIKRTVKLKTKLTKENPEIG